MVESRTFRLTVHYEKDHLWAEVDELPGCFATGRDIAELTEALGEAIGLYLTESAGATTTVQSVELEQPRRSSSKRAAHVQLVPA